MKVRKNTADQNSLIEEHIDFARSLARKFYRERKNVAIDREDLESAAMMGLCDAARRFDPVRGHNFRTFSYFRIRGAMFDLLRKNYWPVRPIFSETAEAEQESEGFEAEEMLEEEPTSQAVFLDTCDPYIANDAPSPERLASYRSTQRRLFDAIDALPETEREIIALYYYEDSTFDQMTLHFEGYSKSWLCRLHQRALKHLEDDAGVGQLYSDYQNANVDLTPVYA